MEDLTKQIGFVRNLDRGKLPDWSVSRVVDSAAMGNGNLYMQSPASEGTCF